jgi:DNA-directed RNA polymerase subunit beta'
VEELFEARKRPKGEAEMSDIAGRLEVRREGGVRIARVIHTELMRDEYLVPGNWAVLVKDEQEIAEGEMIAKRGDKQMIVQHGGRVVRDGFNVAVVYELCDEREYKIPSAARILVEDGALVEAGQQLTDGSKNPNRILSILGRDATQIYLMREIQKVYRSQGVPIKDKHFEVIIRKMLSKVQITSSGDTNLLPGELVNRVVFVEVNGKVAEAGGQPARAIPVLLGITKVALNTESFLSAASFQHTIKVLAQAAIEGKQDNLLGLKENVILGKRVPAGTGFRGAPDMEALPAVTSFEGISLVAETDRPSLPAGLGKEGVVGPSLDMAMVEAFLSGDGGDGDGASNDSSTREEKEKVQVG